MRQNRRRLLRIAKLSGAPFAFGLALSLVLPLRADTEAGVSELLIPDGPVPVAVSELAQATGEVQIVVRLVDAPLSVANGPDAKQRGGKLSRAQQRSYLRNLDQKQSALIGQIQGLGGRELGRVSKAVNAVAVAIDASRVAAVAALPNVSRIRPLLNYELALTDTVPYIGAAAVQDQGSDGTGVTVAVLDSGIDYTHAKLGGSGVVADYTACYATNTTVGDCTFFPNAKVVGGSDFVGEAWVGSAGSPPLAPDPDPIAKAGTGWHGTHVADIVGGLESSPGTGDEGVAPGTTLYAVKVCSAISTACSGLALLQGMDFALDPDGDGDISDAVDVINMSLGFSYGQREQDLSEASANAVRSGVVVVAAAGNDADLPYIVSSPSSTPEVISVAQTQVPSAVRFHLVVNSPASIAGQYPNTATVDWAPIGAGFTGNVAFVGRGCPAGSPAPVPPGGDPYLADPSGKVALIDRGVCNVSLKVDRAASAGAIGVLIGLVAPGDAVTSGFGGGATFVPTLVITQSTANLIKANLAAPVNVTVSSAMVTPLVGSMVGTSSRGPSYSFNAIKPDIAAPGASVSAEAGTGTGNTVFGGTSGATPMVSGSAALLIEANPTRTAAEIKVLLMNTADTNILINPATQPGVLAPITRIGGGEVRVDRAFDTTTAAWDASDLTGSLSFGYQALTGPTAFQKTVRVRNYSGSVRTYSITPSFRYESDAASGAVQVTAPASIAVPANGTANFNVKLKVDVTKLPTWNLNGGSQGGNGALLQGVEFDGYIDIADATDDIHLAWQVLPHKAAEVTPATTSVALSGGVGSLLLSHTGGARSGRVDVFSLLGISGRIPSPVLPQPGDNFAIIDLKSVGARLVSIGGGQLGIQFAINTFGVRAHPNYPAEFDIFIDTNRDGTDDFVVFNLEGGLTGRNVVAAGPLPAGPFTAFFFTDADLDSGNVILTAPLSAIGVIPSTTFDFSIFAGDNYFTGVYTDAIVGMTYTAGTPRYFGSGVPAAGVPVGGSSTLTITAVPVGASASPSQTGLLLMYRDGRTQREADAITVTP
jgi:subtilisin family serine protease